MLIFAFLLAFFVGLIAALCMPSTCGGSRTPRQDVEAKLRGMRPNV